MNKETQRMLYYSINPHKRYKLSKIKLSYTRSSICYYLIVLLILIVLFHRFVIQLGCPDVIKYSLDGLNILALGMAIFNRKKYRYHGMDCCILCILLVFVLFGSIAIKNSLSSFTFSLSNYIFDLRSVVRPFIFFIACCTLLKDEMAEKIKDILIGYHLVNFVYIVYQYFTLDVWAYWMRGDNLNGFFGIATGGNIYVNAMCIVTSIVSMERYKNNRFTLFQTVFMLGLNLILATLIELKMYYFEFALIIFVFIYNTKLYRKITFKRLFLVGVCVMIMPFAVSVLVKIMYKIYPSMVGTLSIKGILKTTSQDGYVGRYDLNRLSFIKGINKSIFFNDIFLNLFGLGIGMANINSEFYTCFWETHYSWFSSAYIYIENGAIGLLLYLLCFLTPVFFVPKSQRRFVVCTVLSIMMLIVYNETLKTEACYLIIFLLASYFVKARIPNNQKEISST